MSGLKKKSGEGSQLLKQMNAQHAVLPIGGKTRVATWGEDPEFPGYRSIIRFASFADFRALHDKYRLKYQPKGKSIGMGTWWLAQPGRRQYDDGLRFMPERDEPVWTLISKVWSR